ncbi:MAG TPA: class I SAM-dependent methyltransferase [Thermoanaerobaculia bacterium]|nr:class I SAM-dependent methyltransferase [Thermoanaerobaculia bacterium]
MSPAELLATTCVICDTKDGATELYPASFSRDAFSAQVFSARRLPDRIHYRMVRCNRCGLVRADPVASNEELAELYAGSQFDYAAEVPALQRTYGRYFRRARALAGNLESVLEIGAGNGFFLEVVCDEGVANVRGIEPSTAAIAAARADIQPRLVADVLRPDIFPPESFDLICAFQVLDHVPDPLDFVRQCHALLRPRGLVLLLMHDVESWSARLMGERSPIIDIEHTYLYSRTTIAKLLERAAFTVQESGAAVNTLTLSHLLHLMPIPRPLKRAAAAVLQLTRVGRLPIMLPLGNLYAIGRKV